MGYALGIDLGTTFTAAAVAMGARTEVVSLGNHAVTIPSMVFLRDDGEVIIGDVAQRRGQQEPDRLAREFKRRFGDSTPIMLGHTPYSAERLMATVLQQVVGQVSERHGGPPDSVAIAHPANWGPYKIELFQQAAQLAGLGQARLVTEPEAAAVHFAAGERLEVGDIVAVYDLGGGTFDAAVLRRTTDGFETLGEPQGIERLGGIDFDAAVMSHVRATLGDAITGLDQADPSVRSAMNRLREECVSAKEALSDDSETSIPVMLPGLQTQVRLTRNELEDALRPALRETVASLTRAIEAAGVTTADLKAIVLAGGSSRIPLVNELVSELGRPVALDAHPKHTVALGAARLARLSGGSATGVDAASTAVVPPVVASTGEAWDPPVPPAGPPPVPPGGAGTAAPPPDDGVPTEPVVGGPPASTPPPVTPTPPAGDSAGAGGPGGAGGRPRWLVPVGALLVLALGVGIVLSLTGGGGGGDDTTTTTAAKSTSSTAAGTPTHTCESSTHRCVFIDSLTTDEQGYVAAYTTVGYEPLIDGKDTDHHIHFFFNSVTVADAGVPGNGPWVVWDVDPDGKKLFHDSLKPSDAPADATQLCAAVATHHHALDTDPQLSCVDLP
jgi:molecular chaperone DnaK